MDKAMDRMTVSQRSENMRRIRGKNTAPEMAVRRLVYSMGYRYRLHGRSLPGSPDLVFKRLQKAILVHGCFWHWHRGCPVGHIPGSRPEYWISKFERNRRRDRETYRKLKRLGWEVLVIWECETKDLEMLAERLNRFLELTE